MRLVDEALGESVRALRAATASAADGEATRARVLGLVAEGRVRRARWRRAGVVLAAVLASGLFGSAAWTAVGHWRARAAAAGASAAITAPPAHHLASEAPRAPSPPPPATAPAGAPELASSPRPAPLGEAELYARAHRAHFLDDAPAAALAAWGRYLAAYPRGAFAPDARFNRALCLLRLDRRAEAERALRPFADGAFRGYRRLEARALLDWLDVRD